MNPAPRNLAAATLLAACALLCLSRLQGAEPIDASSRFQGRDGAPHSFTELRGHPAVINFWATWCIPCRDEMPRLQKLSETYQERGVQFIAISIDAPDTLKKVDEVVLKRNFRIPVWTGASDRTLAGLQLGVLVPATLILDADGEVIGKIEGEASARDVRSRLDWLLNGRKGKQPKIVQKNDW